MKYVNSLKYVDGFDRAGSGIGFSARRLSELCAELGKISIGTKFIHFAGNVAGHGLALFTESILKSAGYRVGRISAAYGYDSRRSVYINGKVPSIDDFNKAVAVMRKKAGKCDAGKYSREEIVISLSLLLCRFEDCEFILLESCRDDAVRNVFSVFAPYDIAVIPSIYETENADATVEEFCEVMKLGVREVVSGSQRANIYNYIENSCFRAGLRLTIPVRAQFESKNVSVRSLEFEYKGKGGYTVRSASPVLRDCAMTAIEIAQAIRRDGVKIAGTAITEGLALAKNLGYFEMISSLPLIVSDICETREEAEMLGKSLVSLAEKTGSKKLSLCLEADRAEAFSETFGKLSALTLDRIYLLGDGDMRDESVSVFTFENVEDMVKSALDEIQDDRAIAIVGSVAFSEDARDKAVDIINRF